MQLVLSGAATVVHAVGEGIMAGAGAAHAAPTNSTGRAGTMRSPLTLTTTVDGTKIGNAGASAAKVLDIVAGVLRDGAAMNATVGSYTFLALRRWSKKPSPSIVFLPHFERAESRTRELCPELCPIACAQNEERTNETNRWSRST